MELLLLNWLKAVACKFRPIHAQTSSGSIVSHLDGTKPAGSFDLSVVALDEEEGVAGWESDLKGAPSTSESESESLRRFVVAGGLLLPAHRKELELFAATNMIISRVGEDTFEIDLRYG